VRNVFSELRWNSIFLKNKEENLNEFHGVCGGRRRTPAAFYGNSRMRDDDDVGGGEIRV